MKLSGILFAVYQSVTFERIKLNSIHSLSEVSVRWLEMIKFVQKKRAKTNENRTDIVGQVQKIQSGVHYSVAVYYGVHTSVTCRECLVCCPSSVCVRRPSFLATLELVRMGLFTSVFVFKQLFLFKNYEKLRQKKTCGNNFNYQFYFEGLRKNQIYSYHFYCQKMGTPVI